MTCVSVPYLKFFVFQNTENVFFYPQISSELELISCDFSIYFKTVPAVWYFFVYKSFYYIKRLIIQNTGCHREEVKF